MSLAVPGSSRRRRSLAVVPRTVGVGRAIQNLECGCGRWSGGLLLLLQACGVHQLLGLSVTYAVLRGRYLTTSMLWLLWVHVVAGGWRLLTCARCRRRRMDRRKSNRRRMEIIIPSLDDGVNWSA